MSSVKINNISKSFGSHKALSELDLDIQEGEFLCVLGPSGCGKTTLLRIIAGLERIDDGEIRFDDELVSSAHTHRTPEERNVGMVFQSYALWPHMTAKENAEFPLKVANKSAEERASIVNGAMDAVRLTPFADRRPSELSGGQQQRVALARCLTQAPKIVLMDEPLANLDMHLREDMLQEFSQFHKTTGSTIMYITHDQAEAMSIADRIAVLLDGKLQQLSRPEELYNCPKNAAVARFIGAGSVLSAVANGEQTVSFDGETVVANSETPLVSAEAVTIVIRPEDLHLGSGRFKGKVDDVTYLGGRFRVRLLCIHQDKQVELTAYSSSRLAEGEHIAFDVAQVWAMKG
ncbi:ABC transporter ATP-binding protein [Pseudovibrio sp. SPO723]|uniref:ABC transporter ATP-binding protein n=1 Tax=Nesiotobacter zosterae TaxID=392721 RepID=UPI0029C1DC19|nr:ABC transporter ATP-binding protein [Pseudovibrio sp. SPO723]MDX5594750.1 ABC transporter ATP-binding protein [Pseudovibrio sp. SPO723]